MVFTIVVNNDGKSDANGIQVTDLLPNGYTYVSNDAGAAYDALSGIWTVGSILNGANATLNISVFSL